MLTENGTRVAFEMTLYDNLIDDDKKKSKNKWNNKEICVYVCVGEMCIVTDYCIRVMWAATVHDTMFFVVRQSQCGWVT